MDKTLNYYKENAEKYAEQTLPVNFSASQDRFLKKLKSGSHILDFGCGAGRDSKYFLDHGYAVTAVDGSQELCDIASCYTGQSVRQMLFQELDEADVYDGIWACASILHLQINELNEVFRKMITALKMDGIIYSSFKYGLFEGERNERWFTDFSEEKMDTFLLNFPELTLEDIWESYDVRPGREEEKWLNIILRKTVSL